MAVKVSRVPWLKGPNGCYRKDVICGVRVGGLGHLWIMTVGSSTFRERQVDTLVFGVWPDDAQMKAAGDRISAWLMSDGPDDLVYTIEAPLTADDLLDAAKCLARAGRPDDEVQHADG